MMSTGLLHIVQQTIYIVIILIVVQITVGDMQPIMQDNTAS